MSKPNLPPLVGRSPDEFAFSSELVTVDEAKSYAEEAVRQALAEAAALCHRKFTAMAEGGFPREASTARKLTAEIEALIPETRDG